MGELVKDLYSVAKVCINTNFNLDGGTPSDSPYSIPRSLKIRILANPDFWGFSGTPQENVLCSGWCVYSNGFFDYFDGFDADHYGVKQCGGTLVGSFKNEQRPDVGYRSVYDDELGRSHYDGITPNDVMRGGAEVYLINRTAEQTVDNNSCDTTDPETVFKKNPDGYGFGNKILFNDQIYKNLTGGWRLSSCENCYASGITNELRFTVCNSGSGTGLHPKQHIYLDDYFGTYYDPAQKRCLSSRYTQEQECQPDGTTPKEYQGTLVSVVRSTGISPYLQASFRYFGGVASGLRNGQQVLIIDSGNQFYNAYHIFDVAHESTKTTAYLLGSHGDENLTYTAATGDKWIALGTLDPESCCGGAALGVNNLTKRPTNQPVYHVDIPKVFNNPKNALYSNRGKFQNGDPRVARNYIAASGDDIAYPYLVSGKPYNPRKLPYYGPYYEVDNQDNALRFFNDGNTITHKNFTCYTKSQTLSIFPDSFTQSIQYQNCNQEDTHYQNQVSRMAFVYRPCNYNEPCSFNSSGAPWTAGGQGMPSTLQDLKNGFGGQEIVMYLNLGSVWGREIKRTPCSCDGAPPGTQPPQSVTILSPVTFPCFFKYDLHPEQYGCQDQIWKAYAKNILNILETGVCDTLSDIDACWTKQPYTTYGYIRNLCGYEGHSRKSVIQSLATRTHNGSYRDTNQGAGSGIIEPMYINFTIPNDVTGSGYPIGNCQGSITGSLYSSGGFTYNYGICLSGNQPYWGLTDSEGRLAAPYFYTKINSTSLACGGGSGSYVDFDLVRTFSGGFPTSGVPFLIEIDHEDYCTGCSTNQIELKDYTITIESLPSSFYHGGGMIDGFETYDNLRYKYGFNHCKYPGGAITPTYNANQDTWMLPGCSSVITESIKGVATPYIDETCDCLGNGISTPMKLNKLTGTNIPKYWSTSGNQNNSYVKYGECGYSIPLDASSANGFFGINDSFTFDFDVYFSARMTCGTDTITHYYDQHNGSVYTEFAGQGLGFFYNCGGCSHSFPATASKPNIYMDWWYVSKKHTNLFEKFTDAQLKDYTVYSFIKSGASRGSFTCGAAPATGTRTCDCADDATQRSWSSSFSGPCHAFSGQRILKWNTNIPGCHGSTVKIYGWNNFKTTSSRYTSNCSEYWHPYNGYGGGGVGQTCDDLGSCFHGGNANAFGDNMASTGYFNIGGCSYPPSDLNVGGDGICGAIEAGNSCITFDSCCTPSGLADPETGLPRRPNQYIVDGDLRENLPGGASGYQNNNYCYLTDLILMGEFTYWEFSAFGSGQCNDGWYGYVNADHDRICQGLSASGRVINGMLAWQGFNLPSIGNVSGIKFNEAIAIRSEDFIGSNPGLTKNNICQYDNSVNRTLQVDSEFIIPSRTQYNGKEVHLAPINCTVLAGATGNKTEVGSTCVKPIPFNTFNNGGLFSGYNSIESTGSFKVDVIKKACFPEIMTVHKVECSGGIYALHVSREYYEHDRILYGIDTYRDSNTNLVVAIKERLYGRISGGRTINKYDCGSGPNAYSIAEICGSGSGCTLSSSMEYFGLIPKMSETDGVTPCYPNMCVTGVNPFQKSLCANYEVGEGEVTTGNGSGGSGYFQVLPAYSGSPTGCLSFYITNPGSGYYTPLYSSGNSGVTTTGCAIAYFDFPPCVRLTLSVYPNTSYDKKFNVATQSLVPNTTPATSAQYFVYSGTISYTNCGGYASQCGFNTGIYPVTFRACNEDTITLPCEPSNQECADSSAYYPNLYNGGAGTGLWNFYNLFYDSGYLGGLCLDDADPDDNVWFKDSTPDAAQAPFPFNIQYDASPPHGRTLYHSKNTNQVPLSSIIPFAETGIKCLHSCIQDHTTCGGLFFCNKEFFPRRSYLSGTKVSKFAPFSICVQNAEKGWGNWLEGHVDDDYVDTYDESVLEENSQNGFLDPCKEGATLDLLYNVGIDDHIIYVSGDINVLLSALHPYYRMLEPNGLDTKSCLQLNSGCVQHLGTHNASTIAGIEAQDFETGDTTTYSEIKQSGCLFEPFKILVDVQCCSERIAHVGTSDPMYLSWIIEGVPAGVCKGWVHKPLDILCTVTDCENKWRTLRQTPGLTEIDYYLLTGAAGSGCPTAGYWFFGPPTPCFGQTIASSGCTLAILYEGIYYLLRDTSSSAPIECGCLETSDPSFCQTWTNAIYIGDGGSPYGLGGITGGSGVKNFGASGCGSITCSNIHYCAQFYDIATSGLGCKVVGGIPLELRDILVSACEYPSIIKVSITE